MQHSIQGILFDKDDTLIDLAAFCRKPIYMTAAYLSQHMGKGTDEGWIERLAEASGFRGDTLLADAPIVCEAFDDPVAKAMLVNGILEYFPEKKLVSATGMTGADSSNTITTRRVMKNFYLCGDAVSEPSYGNGLMAPRVAICAAHEANMITRLLLGKEDV